MNIKLTTLDSDTSNPDSNVPTVVIGTPQDDPTELSLLELTWVGGGDGIAGLY